MNIINYSNKKKGLLFLFFLCASSLFSQREETFKSLTIEDGLSQSQVHCIIQDQKGYLWIGTDAGGLCRYDGRSFNIYGTSDGLSHSQVFSLCEDTLKGTIWIGTRKGLSILNGRKFIQIPNELKPIAELSINAIVFDKKGCLWISAGTDLYYWDGISLVKNNLITRVSCLYKDSQNRIWACTHNKGIFEISSPRIKNYTEADGLKSNTVWSITEKEKNELWIATENGISKFNPKSGKIIKSEKLNLKDIKGIISDNNKNMWAVTSSSGIYRIYNDNYELLTTKQGLSTNSLYCGMKDREGNLWFGTDGSGIMKYTFSPFSKLTEENGLLGNMVLSILHDSKGNEWYGTELGVSTIYTDKTTGEKKINHVIGKNTKYPGERIWSIIEDHKGNIWFSTFENGIYKYDGRTFTNYTKKNGLAANYIRSLCEDIDGNIWMGTMGGLNKYDGKEFKLCKDGKGKDIPSAMAIFKDSKEGIWFATNGGLYKYSGKENQFLSFTEKDGLPSNGLLSIAEDTDGNIWCAGFNGISKVDIQNKICKNISIKEGLTSNSVYILSADKKGNLFVGNNIGIDKIDIAEYNRSGKVIVKHYGKDEGFSGIECNTNASTQDKDGGIWFGTIKGAIRYDASLDMQNNVEPLTHIININMFFEKADWTPYSDSLNEKTALPENLELPFNKNHLTFNCLALSLTIPEKTMYSFKLEGFDQLWSPPSHQTSTTYSYLPPGDYTFLVKAMNNDGVWNTTPSSFSFSIIPPFWKTWWFYLLSFIALALTLTTLYKLRFSALQKRAIQLQEHVDSKTLELRKEKETVESQHKIIEKKNQNIMASINYAQRIQSTVLPIKESLQKYFPQSFILLKPKDIVSGDFYWFKEVGQKFVIAAVDCTGHGIPGAFMSLIGNNLLNNVVYSNEVTNPSHILHRLHEEIVITLKKTEQDSATVDGMDVSVCVIDKNKNELEFASTGQPLIFVSDGNTEIIKSGKYPLGLIMKKESVYETHKRNFLKNDTLYLFTDGYVDQFGEHNDEKFSEERLKNLVKEIQTHDMPTQLNLLETTFMGWKGKLPQLDDTLVIGIRI